VRLSVFDIQGRRIATLSAGLAPAGPRTIDWAAAGLNSGAYVLELQANGQRQRRTWMIVK